MAFDTAGYRTQVIVADGDWRAEFLLRGWEPGVPPGLAIRQRPDIVRDTAAAFLDAGARVLVTSTTVLHAWSSDWAVALGDEELTALNREWAVVLRAVATDHGADARILGALGPTDRLLLLKETTEAELQDAWSAQAEGLAAGGVDAIFCRGFSEIEALCVAVRAARKATGLPVLASPAFGYGQGLMETSLGVTAPQACAALSEAGVACVGGEMTGVPDAAPDIIRIMRVSAALPLWVTISAGMPHILDRAVIYPDTPEEFAARLAPLVQAGVNFVAGGPGAGVAHIAALTVAANRIQPGRYLR